MARISHYTNGHEFKTIKFCEEFGKERICALTVGLGSPSRPLSP